MSSWFRNLLPTNGDRSDAEASGSSQAFSIEGDGNQKRATHSSSNKTSEKNSYGIEVFYEPKNPELDIVFVNGITGGSPSTWTHEESGTLWPRDLLPLDTANARTLSFGYDADVVKAFQVTSQNTLRDHGNNLAMDLSRKRSLEECADRSLIFLAHSLGGLVCEQALLLADRNPRPYVRALLAATRSIIFMGTPHAGADFSDYTHLLTNVVRVARRLNQRIHDVLRPGSEMLASLQQDFHLMLETRSSSYTGSGSNEQDDAHNLRIFCFFEELPFPAVGVVVPSKSAILPRYPKQSIHANHRDMTKFASAQAKGYQYLLGQLQLWMRDVLPRAGQSGVTSRTLQVTDRMAKEDGRQPTTDSRAAASATRQYSGSVYSPNGLIVQGDATFNRDINLTRRFNQHSPY